MRLLTNTETENSTKAKKLPKSIIKGVAGAYLLTFVLLISFALIITYTPLSEAYADIMVSTATIISVIAGAFFSARRTSGRGWLTGIISAIIYFLILWIASCISKSSFYLSVDLSALLGICLFCGALGGILGINSR